MKEKIYTIPVTEAFEQGGECPFCNMYYRLEKEGIGYALGPSYMEDDVRMESNKKGFCSRHYAQMYSEQNRLGLSLMLHTHMQEIQKNLKNKLPQKGLLSQKKSLFKKAAITSDMDSVINYLRVTEDSCCICEKINSSFERYIDTFFYLIKKNDGFIKFVEEGKGFCLNHFTQILITSPDMLSADAESFMSLIIKKQLESMDTLLGDLEWFINKFDYRFQNEPWKNAKDALVRSILKVSSERVE